VAHRVRRVRRSCGNCETYSKPSKVMIDGFRQDMLKLGYVVDENMQLVDDKNKSKGKQNKINAT
jgi:hypothetical protein